MNFHKSINNLISIENNIKSINSNSTIPKIIAVVEVMGGERGQLTRTIKDRHTVVMNLIKMTHKAVLLERHRTLPAKPPQETIINKRVT